MYKVIIVDDEKLLRQGFMSMTDWTKSGFQVAGEAANGREALKVIERVHPDIVVTDIRMPIMNGIELTRIIKERYPTIEVIILSSYNDFEYVKETLKFGALDYILKSKMRYKELIEIMQKASLTINKRQLWQFNLSTNEETESINTFMRNLVHGKFLEPSKISLVLDKFAIVLKEDRLLMMICKLDLGPDEERSSEMSIDNDIDTIRLLAGYINNEIKDKYSSYSFVYSRDTIISILNAPDDDQKDLNTVCTDIIEKISSNYGANLWFLKSAVFDSYAKIADIFSDIMKYSQYCFYKEPNHMYKTGDFGESISNLDLDYKHLNRFVEANEFDKLREYVIQTITALISEAKYPEPYVLKKTIIEIYNFIIHKLPEAGINTAELSQNKFNYFRNIENSSSLSLLTLLFSDILNQIQVHVNNFKYNKYGLTLNCVLNYMKNNYSENISLTLMAEHFHLNKNYLCQLFKQKTGEHFNDYLIKIRIEKAKEMLRQSDQNISVVCELVGFSNPSYFAKIFKEIVGMKPSEYSKIFNN
jgi:two-component system response regulator YesN